MRDGIGDWIFNCEALSVTETVYMLTQTIVKADSNQPVLQLALRKFGTGQGLVLIVNVPLGIYLASGIVGKVDEGEQFNLIWQSCVTQGCQAALGVDDRLKKAMQTGKQLFIGFKPRPGAETFTIAVSLKGVTAGLKALDIDWYRGLSVPDPWHPRMLARFRLLSFCVGFFYESLKTIHLYFRIPL